MDTASAINLLWKATATGSRPSDRLLGEFTRDQAVIAQFSMLDRHLARGERQSGWKIGATSAAMLDQHDLDLTEPLFGYLLERSQFVSGVSLDHSELVDPGFENELGFTLAHDLRGPGISRRDAIGSIGSIHPAIEIVERRGDAVADMNLTIADNLQQRAYVLGPPIAREMAPDLASVIVEVVVDGVVRDRASGEAVLGHPANALAWLANALSAHGRWLRAGMTILSGSFTAQFDLEQETTVEVDFSGVGTVVVSCH